MLKKSKPAEKNNYFIYQSTVVPIVKKKNALGRDNPVPKTVSKTLDTVFPCRPPAQEITYSYWLCTHL